LKKSKYILLFVGAALLLLLVGANRWAEMVPLRLTHLRSVEEGELAVMCFNIHSTDSLFAEKGERIAEMVRREKPNLLYMTECYTPEADSLCALMRELYPSANTEYGTKSYAGDVFFSTWQIDTVQPIRISRPAGTTTRVLLSRDADTVVVYCCHLASNNSGGYRHGEHLRREQADTLYRRVSAERLPVVVMGDMNDLPGSYTLRRLRAAGLRNAWWQGGCGYGATFDPMHLRIDHILYGDGLRLRGIRVMPNDGLSDHNALRADFEL